MQQAIDRGLKGHSGTGVIDWGYIPPGGTKPVRPVNPPKVDKVELPDYKNGKHLTEKWINRYKIKNSYKKLAIQNHPDKGGDTDFFNYITEQFQKLAIEIKNRDSNKGGNCLVTATSKLQT